MIFVPIEDLTSKVEKDFFIEKIDLYIRMVEVLCEKANITIPDFDLSENRGLLSESLEEIGVIKSGANIGKLEKLLGKKYQSFVNVVVFASKHKEIVGKELDKLSNSKRHELQKGFENRNLQLVDFFCGAGGLSLGFLQEGFNVVLANDIEDVCVETYKYNHPELPSGRIIKGDIKEIVDHLENYGCDNVDIVVGGPPCQGFSEANRQRVIDDPRNKLYKYFLLAVERIAPKFVVMENVKGMLKVAHQVVEDYEQIEGQKDGKCYKYKVHFELLNSQDFSVAQSRERLIFIAIRDDVIADKKIEPESIFSLIRKNNKNHHTFILNDALKDIKPLEAPRIKNCNELDSDTTGKKVDVNHYDCNSNPYLRMINGGREIPFVFNHKARYCSDVNYEIYRRLNQGDDATDEKIKDIMPYAHRNHCFKDKYFKLYADRPCRTITAHLRMDCHSHIHPFQVRSLTPREAARVQSFPDDYVFLGAYLKTYMQVGNAVPPLMARQIAKVIKQYLV